MAAVPPVAKPPTPLVAIPPTAFTLRPVHVNADQEIDYSPPQGNKLYKQAVHPLCEARFELDKPSLATFLQVIDDCITECAWEAILSIPKTLNPVPLHNNLWMLMSNYGVVTKTQIDQFVATWITNHDRNCQNCFTSYQCLMALLYDDVQAIANLEQHEFMADEIGCGPKLLQVIINKVTIQNCRTVMELHTQITCESAYMTDIHFKIKVFSEHAKDLHRQIGQYQEEVSETVLT